MTTAPFVEFFTSLQGEGFHLGRRQLFVRFAGCNLGCSYCDTPASRAYRDDASVESPPLSGLFRTIRNPLDITAVAQIIATACLDCPSIHSISLTGGEPLLQSAFIASLLERHPSPRPVHLETNGTLPDALEQVLPHLSFVSMDLKPHCFNDAGFVKRQRQFLGVASTIGHQVKLVIDRSLTDELFGMAVDIVASCSADTLFVIQPDSVSEIAMERLLACQTTASARLRNVVVMPQMHNLMGIR